MTDHVVARARGNDPVGDLPCPNVSGPRVLSLFSGIGGLDLGLEVAGCEIVGSIEMDEVARESLALNRPLWPQLDPHDIGEFASAGLAAAQLGPEVEVIAGAPPCQPFSKAAEWHGQSRSGLSDNRGLLVFDVLDLVEQLRPKVVILENVQGFVRGRTSVLPVLEAALGPLEEATGHRYQLQHELLDAHEFGVAQRRKRAIVVLSRVGEFVWPEPMPEEERPVAWDALAGLEPAENVPKPAGKWAQLLPSIPEGSNYQWHTNRGGGWPLFGYRTRYWQFLLKLAKSQPAWTIAAQPGPSTGPFHWDNRPLTTQEMLRLQSFPADWQVSGTRRDRTRQVGNATPPALAEALGRSLIALLGHPISPTKDPSLALRRGGAIPEPGNVEMVAEKYWHLADEHADHPGAGKGPAPRTPQEVF